MRNKILFLRNQSWSQEPWHTSHSLEQRHACPLCLERLKRKVNGLSLLQSSWNDLWSSQLWLPSDASFSGKHQTNFFWQLQAWPLFPWQPVHTWQVWLGCQTWASQNVFNLFKVAVYNKLNAKVLLRQREEEEAGGKPPAPKRERIFFSFERRDDLVPIQKRVS